RSVLVERHPANAGLLGQAGGAGGCVAGGGAVGHVDRRGGWWLQRAVLPATVAGPVRGSARRGGDGAAGARPRRARRGTRRRRAGAVSRHRLDAGPRQRLVKHGTRPAYARVERHMATRASHATTRSPRYALGPGADLPIARIVAL